MGCSAHRARVGVGGGISGLVASRGTALVYTLPLQWLPSAPPPTKACTAWPRALHELPAPSLPSLCPPSPLGAETSAVPPVHRPAPHGCRGAGIVPRGGLAWGEALRGFCGPWSGGVESVWKPPAVHSLESPPGTGPSAAGDSGVSSSSEPPTLQRMCPPVLPGLLSPPPPPGSWCSQGLLSLLPVWCV